MSCLRRPLLLALLLPALLCGCATAPGGKPAPKPTPTAVPALARARATLPEFQRGVDIDAYTYPGQDIEAAASADIAYVKSLHANSVAISFPFFMAAKSSDTVVAKDTTPTPAQLAVLVYDAQLAGLYITLRPLLDETNLGMSRSHWSPPDLADWFASYQRFLMPYVAMAQREKAQKLIVGTELTTFQAAAGWTTLDEAVRRAYHGVLGCANNWGTSAAAGDGSGKPYAGNCGPAVLQSVDAYQPIRGDLLAGWRSYDAGLPPGTVETEVGIAAVAGAYQRPYELQWPGVTSLDPGVQADWFAAACRAAGDGHLGGIYFWSLGFSANPAPGPTLTDQGQWAGGAGATAIASCFGN